MKTYIFFSFICCASAIIFCCFVGCSSGPEMKWSNPAMTEQEFYRDRAECTTMANAAAGDYAQTLPSDQTDSGKAGRSAVEQGRSIGRAFMRGYSGESPESVRKQVFHDCMMGRGYRLVAR